MLPVASPCAAAAAGLHLEVLDLDEAAALLRVRPEVVRELAEAQHIPARRVGDTWRFSRAALLEWLQDGQRTTAPGAAPPAALGNVRMPLYRFLDMWADASGRGVVFAVERTAGDWPERYALRLAEGADTPLEVLSAERLIEIGKPFSLLLPNR